LGADGRFSLGSKLKFDGTNLDVTGAVHASSGEFTGEVHATSGEFTGAVHASSGEFNGQVNASGGTFSQQILSLLGFKMQGSTGTSCIINKTGMVIYSRVGADESPVNGDTKITIDSVYIRSWYYNNGWNGVNETSGYQRAMSGFSISACPEIRSGLFFTNTSQIIALPSSSTGEDVLANATFDYAYGSCITGWILLPKSGTQIGLGVRFKCICQRSGSGVFAFEVMINTGYTYTDYIKVTLGKLMVKNVVEGSPGRLYYAKSGQL